MTPEASRQPRSYCRREREAFYKATREYFVIQIALTAFTTARGTPRGIATFTS
jgi:hypothetical protein